MERLVVRFERLVGMNSVEFLNEIVSRHFKLTNVALKRGQPAENRDESRYL